MKTKVFSLFLILFCCATISAQEFTGYVKKADSTASPIFQAKVEITEGDKPFKSLKTYFDGSFKFPPNKNQTYSIKISYSGYNDSTYAITSDKNGKVDVQSVTVSLKKDGMRLMGVIKSRQEDFPIKGATIILKNVMTRKEDRITTDIDGKYNFKLEYETNYKVWVDKRSPGIFNLYKDTSFYVSTIGFNQPLDYKLDISLDYMPYIPSLNERSDTIKPSENRNINPDMEGLDSAQKSHAALKTDHISNSVSISSKKEKELTEAQQTISKPQAELVKAPQKLEAAKMKEEVQKRTSAVDVPIASRKSGKQKKRDGNPDVVIISDSLHLSSNVPTEAVEKPQPMSELDITRQKALAEKKAREIETQIAIKNALEKKKIANLALKRKTEEEELIRQAKDSLVKKDAEIGIRQKAKNDSLERAKHLNDSILLVKTQKQKAKQDSLSRMNAERVKVAAEIAAKQNARTDTALNVKRLPAPIANRDSAARKKVIYLTKNQEGLLVAKRKKFVEDSIAMAREYERKKLQDLKKEE